MAVEYPSRRVRLPIANSDVDLAIPSDVFDPPSGFARFCEQVRPLAANDEPDFDLAEQTGRPPDRGQIEDCLPAILWKAISSIRTVR
jgi:hypothetical protein